MSDYAIGFVMKTIYSIKFGAHGIFLKNENICYMLSPDYALGFVMKMIYSIKFGAHGIF